MFGLGGKSDNPLHKAVIDDDLSAVRKYATDSALTLEYGALGFTALELAQFLDRHEMITLLRSDEGRTIQIVLPDESRLQSMSKETFAKSFDINYLEHMCFPSYAALKSTVSNCPYIYRHRLFGSEELNLGRQYQNELSYGHTADIIIRWIDNSLGYGVFLNEDVNEGTFIGEYTGKVRKLCRALPDPNAFCFHYPTKFWSIRYTVIDALHGGNSMRFVNHSDIPNLVPVCMVDRGIVHIVFVANRNIEKGEQLTFDYGEDYWKNRTKEQV